MARLRIPLASAQAGPPRERPLRPQRSEFYDFDLLRHPVPTGRFAERLLKQSPTWSDLETTGLSHTATKWCRSPVHIVKAASSRRRR
jgi:hypothetical protein